jgi:two-component system, NtrC family, nitrogen regulation sensor histidine kinase NtrY
MAFIEPNLKPADTQQELKEKRKRRRELVIIFFVAFLFLFLTWFEIRLFGISQDLPFVHSIFFFGLVNFNIVLLLILLFLIFRNIVKVFVERRSRIFGSSLKSKLVIAFMAFALIPTFLLLITSIFYINSSFDKWFSVKMSGVLKSSLEVTNAYYFNAKKRNYHFAHQIAKDVRSLRSAQQIRNRLGQLQALYSLDAVEYYPSVFGKRELLISDDETIPIIPPVSLEFMQKGLKAQIEASTVHQFGEGNLIRVIVPVKEGASLGAIVVSSFVPLSLTNKMNDISSAFEEFRDINFLEHPLKSIYLIILFLMTLMILFAATWFGFHLARQLAIPLVQLGRATKRLATGDFFRVESNSGSEEINELISSFNQMSDQLQESQTQINKANRELQSTLGDLDRNLRYLEVVLGNVSTGVISVDSLGKITTINRHAGNLLHIDPAKHLGRPVRELMTKEYYRTFSELLRTMKDNNVESIQREFQINLEGEAIPLSMTLTILKNEKGDEIGKVLVFDDLSHLVNAQRAQAWSEVARRIAHEIKNPLTPIKLSAERLQRKFGAQILDPAFSECTTMIVRQTEELKEMVNEFSQFARLPEAKLTEASFNRVIDESLQVFRLGHPHVQFKFEADENLPTFKFDSSQMNRVLVNLLDNAIAAASHEPQPLIIVQTKYDLQLKTMRLTIADNGPGIPSSSRNRVFEPYFSTKEGGTGLGLAIVKRIVEDHSGFIRTLPNEPRGAKMIIELPVNVVAAIKVSSDDGTVRE